MVTSYPLLAVTRENEFYSFSITDVPVRINDKEFILMNRENSPILKLGLCRRGCDIKDIYEGDIIRSNGVDYVVLYQRGMILTSKDRDKKYLWQLEDYEKVGDVFTQDFPLEIIFPKSVHYKYRDNPVYTKEITGMFDGKLFIDGISTRVNPEDLQQYANFTNEGTKVYFGDLIRGYPVELYYGRPVIKHDGIIEDVTAKTQIERKKEK